MLSNAYSQPNIMDTLDYGQTVSAEAILPGKLLSGQYRILGRKPLGAGGMGQVWKAEDTELGTIVAIKVLPPILARNTTAIVNLKREAMIGQQLTHRNISRLYGFHSDGATEFLVMEYVDGRTLSQLLAEQDDRKLNWDDLGPIARQIADALDFAHTTAYIPLS